MDSSPFISQTKLYVIQDRVCRPINFLTTKLNSATALWDDPIKKCQQIEKDLFSVDTVIIDSRKYDGFFTGVNTPRLYHAYLTRVYILLYYRHRDDKLFQEIVFPRLKDNMGIYNNSHLKAINEQIDQILAQEELVKKMQEEKKKDVKPVFAYVSHSGLEQDHLAIEYNEELLFRNMSDIIRKLADKYNTRQDEANVWYNAKQVVHTLRDINRPELLISRAASALVYGQLNNGYNGSQIILICAYAMIRSSKNNSHFTEFIKEMENTANTSTDLLVIKNSIQTIKNWVDAKLPSDGYDYIGEETAKTENYTIADIERITKQFEEKNTTMEREYAKLMEENEQLKNQIELLQQQIEEEGSFEDINWHDKVRLDLLLRLMKKDGADLDKRGNKTRAAEVMSSVTSLPLQTCKNYCSDSNLNNKKHEDEILKLNSILQALGMEVRL